MVDRLEDRSIRAHLWGIPKGFRMSLFLASGSQCDCEQSYCFLRNSGGMNLKKKSLKNNKSQDLYNLFKMSQYMQDLLHLIDLVGSSIL